MAKPCFAGLKCAVALYEILLQALEILCDLRICGHRGFFAAMQKNSMAAFGAAIAPGAEEIEFDIRLTCDGYLVSCHDPCLDRSAYKKHIKTDKKASRTRHDRFCENGVFLFMSKQCVLALENISLWIILLFLWICICCVLIEKMIYWLWYFNGVLAARPRASAAFLFRKKETK